MAMSGVAVDDECIQMWEKMKTKKIKSCRFMMDSAMKKIIIEPGSVIEQGDEDAWKKFTSGLPEDKCRYAAYDVELVLDMGSGIPPTKRNKLTFIQWAPDKAKIRERMVASSSLDAIKKKCDGIQVFWQINSMDDLEPSERISDLNTSSDIKTSGNGIISFEGVKA